MTKLVECPVVERVPARLVTIFIKRLFTFIKRTIICVEYFNIHMYLRFEVYHWKITEEFFGFACNETMSLFIPFGSLKKQSFYLNYINHKQNNHRLACQLCYLD